MNKRGRPETKLEMGSHQIIQSLATMVSILYNIRKAGKPTERPLSRRFYTQWRKAKMDKAIQSGIGPDKAW